LKFNDNKASTEKNLFYNVSLPQEDNPVGS